MFLAQVKNFSKTEWWRYAIGFLIIALFYIIGQVPMGIAWMIKKGSFEALQNTPQRELMNILDNNSTLFFALLMFVFTLLGIVLVLKIHQQSFKSLVTGRKIISIKRILFSFAVVGGFIVISTTVDYFVNPSDYLWNFNWKLFSILLVIAVLMLPIQTSVEELIFRGYLMQGFGIISNTRWLPLVLTSFLFGAMHFSNPEIQEFGIYAKLFYIGTGLFLGIITLMDDGMELALGFHAANNLISALLVTAHYSVIQTDAILKQVSEPAVGATILLPLLIIYPILLFLFAKKYQWTHWKERLLGAL